MSSLHDYILGQIHQALGHQQQTLSSLESEQRAQSQKLDSIQEKIDEALTWGQRLIWLGLALSAAVGLNVWPEKLGEVLAQALRAGLK